MRKPFGVEPKELMAMRRRSEERQKAYQKWCRMMQRDAVVHLREETAQTVHNATVLRRSMVALSRIVRTHTLMARWPLEELVCIGEQLLSEQ